MSFHVKTALKNRRALCSIECVWYGPVVHADDWGLVVFLDIASESRAGLFSRCCSSDSAAELRCKYDDCIFLLTAYSSLLPTNMQ